MLETLEAYRSALVPLIAPLTLIKHQFHLRIFGSWPPALREGHEPADSSDGRN